MSNTILSMGISATLFMSVFLVMSIILLVALDPPYSHLTVAILLIGAGALTARKVYDELPRSDKKRRVWCIRHCSYGAFGIRGAGERW